MGTTMKMGSNDVKSARNRSFSRVDELRSQAKALNEQADVLEREADHISKTMEVRDSLKKIPVLILISIEHAYDRGGLKDDEYKMMKNFVDMLKNGDAEIKLDDQESAIIVR